MYKGLGYSFCCSHVASNLQKRQSSAIPVSQPYTNTFLRTCNISLSPDDSFTAGRDQSRKLFCGVDLAIFSLLAKRKTATLQTRFFFSLICFPPICGNACTFTDHCLMRTASQNLQLKRMTFANIKFLLQKPMDRERARERETAPTVMGCN